jgi:heat shock protein HslJ
MGQCVDIRWNVQGEVDRVTILANGVDLWDGAPVTGNLQDCPPGPGSVTYGVEAVGPGGTSRQQQTISVTDPATATPIPTSAPDLPIIYSFSVSPSQIADGECVGISWNVGGGATYVTILRNGATVIDDAGFAGQQQDCLANEGSYVYRLEAYNIAGQSDFRESSVDVTGPEPPENPLAGTRWSATFVNGAPVLAGTALTANFGADGSLNGSSGCNSYSGSYSVDGSSLSVSPTIGTGVICPEPDGIMEQEGSFLTTMSSTAAFSMEGGQLYLLSGAGQAVIEFVALLR